MRRRTGGVIALIVVCLATVNVAAILSRPSYSVAQVLEGLRRRPSAMLGRPIRVTGVLFLCPPTSDCALPGSLADQHTPSQRLFLEAVGDEPPIGALARRLPVLNALLPPYPPQARGRRGTYTLTIARLPAPACPFKQPVVSSQPYCSVLTDTLGW